MTDLAFDRFTRTGIPVDKREADEYRVDACARLGIDPQPEFYPRR